MSMSDEDIQRAVRDLLSVSSGKHTRTENKWGNIGLIVGAAGGIAAVFLLQQLFDVGALISWIAFFFFGILFFALVHQVGEKENAEQTEKLAEKFYEIFPQGSKEFEKAVGLLQFAKTDSKVEKSLLAALKMDVHFGADGKKESFLDSGNFSASFGSNKPTSEIHSQIQEFFDNAGLSDFDAAKAQSGKWKSFGTSKSFSYSASKIDRNMFDKMVETDMLTPFDGADKKSGVGITPNGIYVYYGNIDIMSELKAGKYPKPGTAESAPKGVQENTAAKDPANQLLGGFDEPKAAPQAASETPNTGQPGGGFIPLDPYSDADKK